MRTDGVEASHAFLSWLHNRRASYSIGFGLTDTMVTPLREVPNSAWSAAIDTDEKVRDGAWVIDATGLMTSRHGHRECMW